MSARADLFSDRGAHRNSDVIFGLGLSQIHPILFAPPPDPLLRILSLGFCRLCHKCLHHSSLSFWWYKMCLGVAGFLQTCLNLCRIYRSQAKGCLGHNTERHGEQQTAALRPKHMSTLTTIIQTEVLLPPFPCRQHYFNLPLKDRQGRRLENLKAVNYPFLGMSDYRDLWLSTYLFPFSTHC